MAEKVEALQSRCLIDTEARQSRFPSRHQMKRLELSHYYLDLGLD